MSARPRALLVVAALLCPVAPTFAQSTTYRLHTEASTTAGLKQLKTASPDAAAMALQSANLQSTAAGEKVIAEFITATGVPGVAGKIPLGATISATVWMKKTANLGAMVPRLKLRLDSAAGTLLCTATGATALSTTLTQYALSCPTTAVVTLTATSRIYVWAGVNLTTTATSGAFRGELDLEGVAGGNYDSTVTVPNALPAPTISSLSPSSGGVGTSVVIAGTNFRDQQLNSTITFFNNKTATVTSWSNTSITATAPTGTTTGAVRVTVAGVASTTATFTVAAPPSITSLTPSSGGVGASVTIAGANFGATQGTSTARFNGIIATPTSWSATSITTPVPSGATTGPVTVTVAGQTSAGSPFTVIPPPTLNTLSPTSGAVGAVVTLTGSNFGATPGTSTVRFNGTLATPTAWSATSITTPVPAGATSGPVTVTVGGQSNSGLTFTVIPPPTLTAVAPSSGGVGTVVTLTGTNFGTTQGTSNVRFNGTVATPTAWSATSITVPVPAGAASGPVTITVASQTSAGVTFTVVPPPTISSVTPASGPVGTVVTLTGTNFGGTQGTSAVSFNGTLATVTAWTASSITTAVPAGAASGPVTVTVAGQVGGGQTFTVTIPVTLTSVTPSTANVGAVVTLAGANFGTTQGAGVVLFNGAVATPTAWSPTSITAQVPAGATSGAVTVTVAGQVSNGVLFTVSQSTTTIAIALTDPFPGTTYNAPASVAVAATATAAGGSIQRVDFYDGPSLIGTDGAAPYGVTWNAPVLGAHILTAVAVDQSGAGTTSPQVDVVVAQAGPTLGTLGSPIVTPPPGVFGAGLTVSWVAATGSTVHYTTDGSTPTESSPVYAAPISIAQSTTIRAFAVQASWSPSVVTTAQYVVDTVPPFITTAIAPAAGQGGWVHSPVSVSFSCADASGIATCPMPVEVVTEGPGIVVNGTAFDTAGNSATASAVIAADWTPPSITVTSAIDQSHTQASTIAVEATVADSISGVVGATCGGVTATVVSGSVACVVPLKPGWNSIVIAAMDGARNSSSAGVRVFREVPLTSLVVTPTKRSLLVGDTKRLTVADQSGAPVLDANWASSDASVVVVIDTEDGPALLALASGHAVVTASAGALTAAVDVTVFGGTSLPPGTAKWETESPGTFYTPMPARQATPEDPEQFAFAVDDVNGTTVVGLGVDGRTVWSEPLEGSVLLSDSLGGVISAKYEDNPIYGPLPAVWRRIAGTTGGSPWEYRLGGWVFGQLFSRRPAQAMDGTLYHLEYDQGPLLAEHFNSISLVAVDGRTGLVRNRVMLPMSKRCLTPDVNAGGGEDVLPLFVGSDGAAYVTGVTRNDACPENGPNQSQTYRVTQSVFALRLGPVGPAQWHTLKTRSDLVTCASSCSGVSAGSQAVMLTPDGLGGMLVEGYDSIFDVATEGNSIVNWAYRLFDGNTFALPQPDVLGNVRAVSQDGTMYSDDFDGVFRARSSTGAVTWSGSLNGATPLQTVAGGGLLTYDSFTGSLTHRDAAGAVAGAYQLPLLASVSRTAVDEVSGMRMGPDGTGLGILAKIATPGFDDTTVLPNPYGQQAALGESETGIFAKSHRAVVGVSQGHVAIRIVPRNQVYWRATAPRFFKEENKLNGRYLGTLGAAASGFLCSGYLNYMPNRPSDLSLSNKLEDEGLAVAGASEDATIGLLLNRVGNILDNVTHYRNNHLSYACSPNPGDSSYNSNGFAHGLLEAAGIPPPAFPSTPSAITYPGWTNPVPPGEFDPHP